MKITIVGWHIHEEAAICTDCGNPAHVVATYDGIDSFDLCNACLPGYKVKEDKINEIFKKLGF